MVKDIAPAMHVPIRMIVSLRFSFMLKIDKPGKTFVSPDSVRSS